MAKRFPILPAHPERNCWGCDAFCSAQDLRCGNGAERTQHPVELWGPDWPSWEAPGPGAETGSPHPGEALG